MKNITVDKSIDCKGLACPMPIVRTKKAMDEMKSGEVLEVVATDPGSVADVRSWADRTGHQFLGTITENSIYKHYIRKADPSEIKSVKVYPHVVSNEELEQKLDTNPLILDVREPMEYAFGHIPGARLVPFGKLQEAISELLPYQNQEIYVVCRTGSRSDAACQVLQQKGFTNVKNVVPGMSSWKGPVEKQS
ncbi:MAG: sulfurtransferase TusA family protein [Brevibacillus sp.]|nr:sulfurtransferase TusA family protein [Brevibacillus sp.]